MHKRSDVFDYGVNVLYSYTYDVPTRFFELFLEARELASIVYRNDGLPREQRQYADQQNADHHAQYDQLHIHRLPALYRIRTVANQRIRVACTYLRTGVN